MKKPKVKSSKYLHRGFFDVKQDLLEKPNGETIPYTSLMLSTYASAVLAQDELGRWILNKEYRHPTGEYVLGCPGGRLEEGEDPVIGARRELLEETGYYAEELIEIGCCYALPSLSDQKIHFFWAPKAVKKGEKNLDPFEYIETELKSDAALKEEIRSGTNIDAILLAALWYKDHFI